VTTPRAAPGHAAPQHTAPAPAVPQQQPLGASADGGWFELPGRHHSGPAAPVVAAAHPTGDAWADSAGAGQDTPSDELSTVDALARARAGLNLPTLTPVGWVTPTPAEPRPGPAPDAPASASPQSRAMTDLDIAERALTEWALRDRDRNDATGSDLPAAMATGGATPLLTEPPTVDGGAETPMPASQPLQAGGPLQAGDPMPVKDEVPVGGPVPVAAQEPPVEPSPPAGPTAAEQLAGIRWRLDGATLREVVDDFDELRELGARLDEPLAAPSDNRSQARLLSLRAVVYRLLGELGMAAAASRLSLSHAEAAADPEAIVVAQAELAHVLRLRGEFAEADVLFEHAASAEVPELLRCVVHENAGRSCYDQGRYMESLDHFTRAIRLADPGDLDLVERVDVALEAVYIRVLRDGWGPYPRLRREILAADSRFTAPT
jgi:hypothetical protein